MRLADLDPAALTSLLYDLRTIHDVDAVEAEYRISIPQWLTIKYRCVSCAKETNNRIQTITLIRANQTLTCPFCRKVSQMFTIRTEKEALSKKDFEL